jgi:hypothetical protein
MSDLDKGRIIEEKLQREGLTYITHKMEKKIMSFFGMVLTFCIYRKYIIEYVRLRKTLWRGL